MQKLRAEPFLWIHIAGIVVFPLWMALTVIGLATGAPLLPVWLEQLILLTLGIGLVARMQIRRPFYLFSVLAVSLPPEQLSPQRCRILSGFQSWTYRLVPLLVILVMILLGEWLYDIAPLFHSLSFLPENRVVGLGVAILGFWGANLFIQIPAAAAWALSSDQHRLDQYSPVDPETVESQFTVVGRRWSNLLSRWDPATLTETPPAVAEDVAEDHAEDQTSDQPEEQDPAVDQTTDQTTDQAIDQAIDQTPDQTSDPATPPEDPTLEGTEPAEEDQSSAPEGIQGQPETAPAPDQLPGDPEATPEDSAPAISAAHSTEIAMESTPESTPERPSDIEPPPATDPSEQPPA